MPLNNGIVTAPVDIGRDVAAIWGSDNYDLGYLIQNKPINKWAKYKPIIHTNIGIVTEAERIVANQGFVADGSSANSLIQTSESRAFSAARDYGQTWSYQKPTGVIGVAPYRDLDFACVTTQLTTGNGYNHNAVKPVVISDVVSDQADANRDVKIRVDFYYIPAQITFSDIRAINDLASSNDGTWYWCIFAKIPGNGNQITCHYLYTDQTYATKMIIGSMSSNIKRGFTHITVAATASGTCEAYLGLVCLSNQTSGELGYAVAPAERDANFEVVNVSAGYRAAFLPLNPGMRATWVQLSGQKYITSFMSSIGVQYIGASSLSSDMTLTITERIYGKVNGSYLPYQQRVSTKTVGPNAGDGGSVIGQWDSFAPMLCDDPNDMAYTLKLQLGAMSPLYFALGSDAGMQQSITEVYNRIADIISVLGSTYAELVQETT